ncbi:MAG: DUF1592 domain-containing protein [Isosphaeraceae bacterium]
MTRPAPRSLIFPAALLLAILPVTTHAEDALSGEQIFVKQCARCHGNAGEGSADYPRELIGDRTVPQLARLISRTMPEDDPGTCKGDDAEKVAAYIFDAFYSPAAQAKNRPPRVELARLTGRQYQNAVADLIGSYRGSYKWDSERGLHGEYFKSRNFRTSDRAIDRRDPVVKFDFGTGSPDKDKMEANGFTIRWEGSVLAPESGEYEFIVRTEHAARLYVNDARKPLIDAWVKSGNDTEYRGSLRLIGGRPYSLKLEFSKAKQGVDDSKKKKKTPPPEVKASISLSWKPPARAEEIIPAHALAPHRQPETFVLNTPLPPDDRSMGYERGTSVSKAWDQATTDAAIEVAGYVTGRRFDLTGVGDSAKDKAERLKAWCVGFAERALRRPLTDAQKTLYIDYQFRDAKDPDVALKRVVILVLKSPWFLYREPASRNDAYDVAARLSFGLWDSIPDRELTEAARDGKLATREQVEAQASRMLNDLRTRSKVREFLFQWLKVEQTPDVSKDPKLYPEFDNTVLSDLRSSLDLFLDDVVWGEKSDFRRLLLSDEVFLNGRLSKVYGGGLAESAQFSKVKLDPEQRAGVLTHPYLMSVLAYTASSSPIYRGVLVARGVLGRALRPPPIAVAPLAADLHAGLTTRERITLQTKPAACITCHGLINPLGFPLEHFDAVGRYRAKENDRPVDSTGLYQTLSGETVTFQGARDLAEYLAGSDETHSAFVRQLFHYLVKQPIRAYGVRTQSDLKEWFVEHDYSVRSLVARAVVASALPPSKPEKKTP